MKSQLDTLIAAALDARLSEAERAELNELMRKSPETRTEYLRLVPIHAALHRFSQSGDTSQAAAIIETFPPKNSRITRIGWIIGAAACVIFFGISLLRPADTPAIATMQTSAAVWEGAGPKNKTPLAGQTYSLKSGFASLTFSSGVEVTLQAPCRFSVTDPMAMNVNHGRAAVRVPEGVNEFVVTTPGGDFVDLGTEFGIAVGSDGSSPVVLTDVFSGEIEIRAATQSPQRLQEGQARALLGKGASAKLVTNLEWEPVALRDMHRSLPDRKVITSGAPNLALGKPVFSPAYLTRPYGSVFPPEKLTDGRGEDSGVPGDWSFWLAPNGEAGEFTVDLLGEHEISRVELQNTRNRNIGDRGMRRFRLLVSNDNRDFTQILEGELEVVPLDAVSFNDVSFSFPPVTARYVKLEGLDHHRSPNRPANHPHQGGGLNEIRIFAH